MKFIRILYSLGVVIVFLILMAGCSSDDSGDIDEGNPVSPVHYDPATIPYTNLSTYNFFQGDLKNLNPVYGVLPYELISSLFTDYAHKKRFVWMPTGSSATYSEDGKILHFPVGTILIKNFYYDTMQPNNSTQILETRLMINTTSGWIFAEYVWNDSQTEATLDMNGQFKNISFEHNGNVITTDYRIPNETECFTCHKINETASPIGPKPQNLNKTLSYPDNTTQNQLSKWQEQGYLNSYPSTIQSVVNWEDSSQDLELRVRSYLDINCAHCHIDEAHCDYTPMRFAFADTVDPDNLGICIPAVQPIPPYEKVIEAGNINRSVLSFRINSNDENVKMPLLGRTIVHEEATMMIDTWINSLTQTCN